MVYIVLCYLNIKASEILTYYRYGGNNLVFGSVQNIQFASLNKSSWPQLP